MVTKVQKWGNSQGLRLAKHVLESANVAIGDDAQNVAGEEHTAIGMNAEPKFDLAEMVKRMPYDYHAQEDSFGKPVGLEEG